MKTIIISTLTAIILFFGINSDLSAQPRHKFKERITRERIIDKLNLTEEQKDKISELRSSHQKKMADYKAELEKAKIDLRDLQNSDELNRNNIISAVEKINSIKNQMAIERTNHRMDIYELLNDEQKEIWRENRQYRGKRNFGFNRNFQQRRFNCF